MTSSQPTLIVGLYWVRRGKRDQWFNTWQHVAAIARSRPECQAFKLNSDPADRNLCWVSSTWSNDRAFDCLVREVGLVWLERHFDYSESPPTFTHFPLSNQGAVDPMEALAAHA